MKKLFFLPLLAALAIFASCSSDDNDAPLPKPEAKVTSVDYYGIINVGNIADTVRCTVVYDNAANIADITLRGMRFSDRMPAVDMRMAGIACSVTSTDIVFAPAEAVVPEVSVSAAPGAPSQPGVSNPQYAMEELVGTIKDKTMEFTAKMPMGEVDFFAVVVPLFTGEMNVVAAGSQEKFAVDNVECEMELDADGNNGNLIIYGAKFAAAMPVTVDIKLENLACTNFQGGYNVAVSDTLVPLVRMSGSDFVPMPAFAFTKLRGEVLDLGSLNFDASMTRGDFSYYGERYIKIINR